MSYSRTSHSNGRIPFTKYSEYDAQTGMSSPYYDRRHHYQPQSPYYYCPPLQYYQQPRYQEENTDGRQFGSNEGGQSFYRADYSDTFQTPDIPVPPGGDSFSSSLHEPGRHPQYSAPMTNTRSMAVSTMVTPTRPPRHAWESKYIPGSSNSISMLSTRSPVGGERTNNDRTSRNDTEPIRHLHQYDVLCGRGAPVSYHRGNQMFRELIQEHQTVYLCSKRAEKPAIAWKIFDIVKSRGGRFVRRNKAHYRRGSAESPLLSFAWEELSDKQAYEKICQSLREGAPELRRRMFQDVQEQRRPHYDSSPVEADQNVCTTSAVQAEPIEDLSMSQGEAKEDEKVEHLSAKHKNHVVDSDENTFVYAI